MARKNINIRAGYDLSFFSESSQNLIRKLHASGQQMKAVGRQMSMSLTAPIVGLGAVATRTFATFEQSMAKVQAISGATGTAFKDLEKTARQLGMTTRFSASEVADLMLNYSKLGFSSSEIQKITGATLDLALATGEDLARSAEIAGGTLRGFALEADQMTRVTDVMAKSFSSSALDLEKFQNAMPKVSAVASSLGITLEETTAMLGVLANKNIRATTAGTGLKNIFLMTRKSGMSFNDAMDKINQSIDPTTTAMNMFGKENATVAVALAQSGDAIVEMTAKLEDANGAAKDMAKIMDDTLEGSMHRLRSAVSEMGISIGEKLAPHIIKVTNFLSNMAESFAKLNPETQQIIIQLAATAAAIGPLIYAFGALKLAMAFLIAHPAVLVAIALTSALAALNIVASETNKIFDNVKTATDSMETAYNELSTAVDNLNRLKKQGLKASKDEIKLAIQSAKAKLKQAEAYFKTNMQRRKELALQKKESLQQALAATRQVGKQGEFIGAELAQTKQIEANILAIDEKLAKLTEQSFSAKDGIKELEAQLKQIENLKPSEKTFFGTTTGETKTEKLLSPKEATKKISTLKAEINDILKDFKPEIIPVVNVEKITEQLQKKTETAKHKFVAIGEQMGEALASGLERLVENSAVMLGEFIGDAMTGDADVQDFGKGLLNVVGGFLQQMGAAMIAFGISFDALQKSISTLNPALAIAGGVALVAAGAVISNLSKKGLEGGGGGLSPSPSMAGGGGMGSMNTQPIALETKISGRDLILVQNREKGFTR